ncbi:flavodoxin family protein [Methanofollis formosanus]|uniref:Flavodoxin family protein n=1 Tax=Methanofollis formosanus TaxID=299308 RepID=A0A8G1A0L2_9EURY|nr:flavodoxin family protein [Methanofollis formosanus]QYZ78340.1 flavodoxin family protein [Methanofollis formosanus]
MAEAVLLKSAEVEVRGERCELVLFSEDLSEVLSGMTRYTLELRAGGDVLYTYHTNTYEYPPGSMQTAHNVAVTAFFRLKEELPLRPDTFLLHPPEPLAAGRPRAPAAGAVLLQGSPRPHGNSAVLAGWVADRCNEAGLRCEVISPDRFGVEPCTACYRCFNSGRCVIEDRMDEVVPALDHARLIVVCTPVYTETVPAALKAVIDRCQALRAGRALAGVRGREQAGLLLAVAGRRGSENFECVRRVVGAFFTSLGVRTAGEVLLDGVDDLTDIRAIAGWEEEVRERLSGVLEGIDSVPPL